MAKVDVAICVYGKPYQTAATLVSLAQHCGSHVERVFIQEEKLQPYGEDVSYVKDVFPELDIVQYVPPQFLNTHWLAEQNLDIHEHVRLSVRYQMAWEQSDRDFIFIIHNDVLFSGDTIGEMMDAMGDVFTGAGIVGQCWNCPMNYAGVCSGERHETFNPTYEEVVEIVRAYPSPRTREQFVDRERPMPLLECRLGEFACLVNLRKARPLVRPVGPIVPFGWYTYDTGVEWFRQMRLNGHRFVHMAPHFQHAPFVHVGNGNEALSHSGLYQQGENGARFWLQMHSPEVFERLERFRAQQDLKMPYEDGYLPKQRWSTRFRNS